MVLSQRKEEGRKGETKGRDGEEKESKEEGRKAGRENQSFVGPQEAGNSLVLRGSRVLYFWQYPDLGLFLVSSDLQACRTMGKETSAV